MGGPGVGGSDLLLPQLLAGVSPTRGAERGGGVEGGVGDGAEDSEGSKRGDKSVSARPPPAPTETSLSSGAA